MATFTAGFTPSTSTNGANLLITDTSVYGGFLPKSAFTARSVVITKTDGTTSTTSFPFNGSIDSVADVLTLTDFFNKDYYVTIAFTWTYSNEGTPASSTETQDYISHYNALICFIASADESECSCESTSSSILLTKLNTYIQAAVLWGKFGNPQKSQKFLDAAKEVCDSLDDCNN